MKYPETVSPRTTVYGHSVIGELYMTISRHPEGSWGESPCPLGPIQSSKISHVPSEVKCNTFFVKMSFVGKDRVTKPQERLRWRLLGSGVLQALLILVP